MATEMPGSFADWVSLLIQLGGVAIVVAGFLWRVIRQPLLDTINGLGGRVKAIEENCAHSGTLLDKHDRAIERVEGAVVEGKERIGRIEGAVERLVTAIERNRDAHTEEESEIRERLVRIETKVETLLRREEGGVR